MLYSSTYDDQVASLLKDSDNIVSSGSSDQFLFILLGISVFFLLVTATMSLYILKHRKKSNQLISDKVFFRKKYQDFLSDFLLLPVDSSFVGVGKPNTIQNRLDSGDITTSWKRLLLLEEIYNLKKDLSGQQAEQLTNYFYGLSLQEEVLQKMKSSNAVDIIKALQITGVFKIQEFAPQVETFLEHSNRAVVMHGILTTIQLHNNLDILHQRLERFNQWELHKLLSLITEDHLIAELKEMLANTEASEDLDMMSEVINSRSLQLMN